MECHLSIEDANGLICVVLPKSPENELLDVNGRALQPLLESALQVQARQSTRPPTHNSHLSSKPSLWVLLSCKSENSLVPMGWYFYDDMQNRGKALYIGPSMKFWHNPSTIVCLMYIKQQ